MTADTSRPAAEPLVVRPKEAKVMYGGCSDDELNGKIKRGEIDSYLDGRRRLITVASIKADIARKVTAAAKRGFEHASGSRMRKAPDGVGFEHAKPGAPRAPPED
jgi:hypothetical protein